MFVWLEFRREEKMSTIFLKILNISITAGWLILAVIALRLLLTKAPKWISCLLWALVALRLLIPFSIESAMSLIPSGEVVSESIVSNQAPAIDTGFVKVNAAVNPIITETFAPKPEASVNPMQMIVWIASVIWIAGMAAMFIYAIVSFLRLKKQVSASTPVSIKTSEGSCRVMLCDDIKSPFILGIFKPVIYIPSNLDLDTIELVFAHENAHIKRHDNIWKPLGFALLSIYWFNPLCWIAYILLSKDIEAACDEKVIKDKDRNYLALYSQALLDCAVQRKRISACPLAFGENGVKGRVKGILNYKKPAFWIILISFAAIAAVAICFLTNPSNKKLKQTPPEVQVGFAGSEEKLQAECVGFADPESVANAEVVHLESEYMPTNEELEERIATLHADDENILTLSFSDKPSDVKVEFFDEINPSDEVGFSVADYDMQTNSMVVSSDSNYTYIVTAEWEEAGTGFYLFRISRDGFAEPEDEDIQSEIMHFSVEIPPTSEDDSQDEIKMYIPGEFLGYEYVNGQYVVSDNESYKYKKILVGKDPGASCIGEFVVLTNDPDITYETVSKSLFSSNMDDWLTDTAIIEIVAITDKFEGFSVWPTKSTLISHGYDEKDHPETDIPGETGDPVYAIADGLVFYTGSDQKKGNTIKILSADAVIEYTHLDSISVNAGDTVSAGDTIGNLGNTGLSTGPHLGLSLTVNGLTQDMTDYYKN